MKCCKYILQDINFEPQAIQSCCNVFGIKVPFLPYQGGNIDQTALVTYIANTLSEIQTDSPLCKGCENLEDVDFSNSKHKLEDIACNVKFKTVSFNQHRYYCNCRCVYCNLWGKKEKIIPYSPLAGLQDLYNYDFLSDKCFFSWGGGESTILKDFTQTATWIYEKGFFQNIHTNAMQMSPIILAMLNEAKCSVNISLDAGTQETFEKVKGVPSWTKVLNTLQKYRKSAINPKSLVLKYIVFEQTNSLRDIDCFVKICKGLDIRSVQISLDFREINANTVSKETVKAVQHLVTQGKENNFEVQPFYIPQKYLKREEKC